MLGRSALHALRWCELKGPTASAALWMPLGALHRAFRPDWPVEGLPHAFALPTIYQVLHYYFTTTVFRCAYYLPGVTRRYRSAHAAVHPLAVAK